ncbi:D-alanyl-D-alanine carboxypeptidase family protein [Candidatus Nomurabacteria bacterium]|nr:D-alanyl-D-alanine carboxypeptidase family protein [Candidatus Nomurabacteria bacterium]
MSLTLQNTLTVLLVLATLGGGAFIYWQDKEHNEAVTALESTIDTKNKELALKENVIGELSSQLEMTSEELSDTIDRLSGEKERNDEMEDQVRELAGTVSDLDKLSKTDKELLQKYSKVYFLNEHYIPESLREIDDEWKYSEDSEHQLHSKVMPFFEKMMEDALEDGIEIWVTSAFRSFDYQSQLKGSYTVIYGSGANAFSADQGFSEHQLGTTIDFTTRGLNGGLSGFQNTEAYKWLLDNAHKYGFTLSYPEGNTYYVFEPWHWRFVGEELAKDLNREDAHFYDWEQRTIDQYLLHIFD